VCVSLCVHVCEFLCARVRVGVCMCVYVCELVCACMYMVVFKVL